MELARPNEESWRMRRRGDEGVGPACVCLSVSGLAAGGREGCWWVASLGLAVG